MWKRLPFVWFAMGLGTGSMTLACSNSSTNETGTMEGDGGVPATEDAWVGPSSGADSGSGSEDSGSTDKAASDAGTGGSGQTGTGGSADSGTRADSGTSTGDAGAGACGVFTPNATLAAQRDACTFKAGAKTADTVDDGAAARAAITHVIIMTHENRSLDHMYATLGGAIDGFPTTYTNRTGDGGTVAPYHLTTSCPPDINHSPMSIRSEWDNGKMDGFFDTDGIGTLGYYEPADHPFYSWLVTTFAMSDHYFCGMMGDTGPNRRFLYGASATTTNPNIFHGARGCKGLVGELLRRDAAHLQHVQLSGRNARAASVCRLPPSPRRGNVALRHLPRHPLRRAPAGERAQRGDDRPRGALACIQ